MSQFVVYVIGPNPLDRERHGGVARHVAHLEKVLRGRVQVQFLYTDVSGRWLWVLPRQVRHVIGTVRAALRLGWGRKDGSVVHLNATLSASGVFRLAIVLVMCWVRRIPVFLQIHGGRYSKATAQLVPRILWRGVFRQARAIGVFPGPQWRELEGLPFHAKLRPMVNMTDRAPAVRRDPEEPTRFLFLGRLVEEKGLLDVLAAFQELRARGHLDARLTVAGDGPMLDQVRRRSLQAGFEGAVTVTGFVQGTALRQLLEHCNAFVLPSYEEGFPLAFLECAAWGMASIVTQNSAIPEYFVENVEFLGVKARSPLELATRMEYLCRQRNERVRMGEAARRRVEERFLADKAVTMYLDIYKELATGA